jgi:hypothetical protein
MVDVTSLRERVNGPVFTAADDGYYSEVASWNRAVGHRPDVAVGATSSADVVAAVLFARDAGLTVSVQSTGHGAERAITSGVMVTTRRLADLEIYPEDRTAVVGAGVTWERVIHDAASHSLTPIAGSSPTVGAVGLLLGGGLGPLARSHGFSSDYLRSLEVVTATGAVVTASETENPELFWALRGGKTGLGIVVSVQLRLVELSTLYAGSLVFAEEHIERVLTTWVAFVSSAPDDITTSIAIVRYPDFPVVPEPLRGRTLLSVRFAYPGDAATGESLARPLRRAAPPYMDALGSIPTTLMPSIHNDPTEPIPAWTAGRMVDSIDTQFLSALLAHVGAGRKTPFLAAEIRHIGAATRRDVSGGSAVGGRDSDFLLNLIGAPDPALFEAVLPAASHAILTDLGPWVSEVTNVNFVGYVHPHGPYVLSWPTDVHHLLERVRRSYDPESILSPGVHA